MRWLLLLVLACLAAPSSALAWTDASVTSAHASLNVDGHAHAHVVVEVVLRVDGGWLEGFELDGLDPDLVLDPSDPVTLVRLAEDEGASPTQSSATQAFAPRVEVHDGGRIVLSIPRRGAPRRGQYLVHVAYDTVLAGRATTTSSDGLTVRWTFPAWRYGLDSVEVDILAPAGTIAVSSEDDEIGLERTDDVAGAHITLTRAHLARTREWPIDILVPLSAVDASLAMVPEAPAAAPLVSPVETERPWHAAIALALASILVALRVSRAPTRTLVERSVEHALVPISARWRARAILVLGLVLALLDRLASSPFVALGALAVVLLAASQRAPSVLSPKLGSFRHATPTLFRAGRRATLARTLGIDAWLDATTVPGIAVLALLASLVLSHVPRASLGSALVALALVVHAFLVDPRTSRPEPALVTLDRLVRFARRLQVSLDGPPIALLPVIHLGVGGEAHEARLRVVGQLDAEVLRTDVVPMARGLFGARYGLLVVVRRGGPADAALSARPELRVVSVGSERIARIVPIRGRRVDEAFATLVVALRPAAVEPAALRGAA